MTVIIKIHVKPGTVLVAEAKNEPDDQMGSQFGSF
jgi:hypothetical protein